MGRYIDAPVPFSLNAVFVAVGFIALGRYLTLRVKHSVGGLVLLSVTLLLLNLCVWRLGGFSDSFYEMRVFNEPLFIFTSVIGTYGVVSLSQIIKEQPILEWVGKNSLFIYGIHYYYVSLLGKIFKMEIQNMAIDIILTFVFTCVFSVLTVRLFSQFVKPMFARWLKAYKNRLLL